MNIHFNEKEIFENLMDATAVTVKVGSHMYDLDNEKSDDDFLNIYIEAPENRNTFMWEHHQLQYKSNNTDYNFTTLQGFIRNALSGDATINFEVLFSDALKNSDLDWLYLHRHNFINYNIIKSYLGMAKRDLKFYKKDTGNLRRHTNETDKKLSHFVRGVIFAKMLMKGEFVVNMKDTHTYPQGRSDLELLKGIKEGDHEMHEMITNFFEKEMNTLRDELNSRLEKGEINRVMYPNDMRNLDISLAKYLRNRPEEAPQNYGYLFYEALENGVNY